MQSRGIVRGKCIELEKALPYTEGCLVNVIVELENSSLHAGSPAAILQAMHEPLHLADEAIDELEQAIVSRESDFQHIDGLTVNDWTLSPGGEQNQ